MFLPTTQKETAALGWNKLDIILVTGDAYVDAPMIGASVIGNVLADAGYKVGMIAQPDTATSTDITRLGEPSLFWGVTGGCMDSMVANYTATKKRRKSDDLTAGGKNVRRPDRALIVYTNLIRKHFKNTSPIVLGGIEASLRRISHYDYWSDKVRRSVLFDSKANILVYGMGEKTILELADKIKMGLTFNDIPGTCTIGQKIPEGYLKLPSHEKVVQKKSKFLEMFQIFYENNDPVTAKGLAQKQDTRFLIHHPPSQPLEKKELDRICELTYEREIHPSEKMRGNVRALDTIRFSLSTHRGCYGECNFCAITVHQGRQVVSRSASSVLKEAASFTRHPKFKGIISDVGGPTANMYGFECGVKEKAGSCRDKRCLTPEPCKSLPVNHLPQINLLKKLQQVPGIRKIFIGSGIRHDLVLNDKKTGDLYLETLVKDHISGQMKIAPEHSENRILDLMGKPKINSILEFKSRFDLLNQKHKKRQFLTYYFIAAYPGCEITDMARLKKYVGRHLHLNPEQVQIFTPTPGTIATLMYYMEKDPFSGKDLFVEKTIQGKEKQKGILQRG